jgi:hypothetical protein
MAFLVIELCQCFLEDRSASSGVVLETRDALDMVLDNNSADSQFVILTLSTLMMWTTWPMVM